ncbi:hypothetical protein [Streptomyces thermoviolaceus]|uniref:hypothetical protein n=1 Tax=Streptomyces thermoviolaceus TaxID=1952 RepID=UPI00386CF857
MDTVSVPHQSQPASSGGPSPVPPQASEATRLLCAGVYLDPDYRDRVIEELYLHEQRIVAPSLGFDAARVLAHALRARRAGVYWSAAVVGLWIVGCVLTSGLMAFLLVPSLLLAFADALHSDDPQVSTVRKATARAAHWVGRMTFAALLIVVPVMVVLIAAKSGDAEALLLLLLVLIPLALFAAIAVCAGRQRGQFARALNAELSPDRFADIASDPAERAVSPRLKRLKQRIRQEQHAPLILYRESRPFCGSGRAYDTWVLAVEMRPAEGRTPRPLSNRIVLDTVRPLLESLRLPPEYAGHLVRDRLRWLEIDECVFLPAEGLPRREDAPYDAFAHHRDRAVEEGAERRRHFLRVRVGGWEENLVVTVYVRIHTQGRMLMLEVVPHVLMPVREDFRDADRIAYQLRTSSLLAKATWMVGQVPGATIRSVAVLFRAVWHGWQLLTGEHRDALPDGPVLSVRELGSAGTGSLFQQMDVDRYLRSIQDRIAHGVRTALSEHGYETGEFVQKVVNISNGGVHIDSVEDSTFAIGTHARAASGAGAPSQDTSSTTGGHRPNTALKKEKGSGSDEHGG